jgi:gamma-glutamyltranspeptidase/glutathione hydrolase
MTSRPKLAFVPPCLPTLVARSPGEDGWLHEVKHDGYRAGDGMRRFIETAEMLGSQRERDPTGQETTTMRKRGLSPALAAALTFAWASAAIAASRPAVEVSHGMVVSSQHYASEAGRDILQAGGNAIDAAVAVGYALAVVNPCCGNIGGGGFMTIHLANGRDTFINFRETAPQAATETMYLDQDGKPITAASLYGYLAAGVPGTVMGLDRALSEYGTMPREKVMAPAIALARDGYVLTRGDTDVFDAGAAFFGNDPVAAMIFLRPDGSHFQPGDRHVQSDLAATLALVAKDGPDAFYKGPIAKAVEAASRANGGILTAADFAAYTVTEGPPLTCSYRGFVLASSPPPSSGGTTICEILNILEGYDMKAAGFHSARAVHLMVEAMRHAYLDRNTYLGDPAFVKNPLERLLSKDYAAAIRAKIDPEKATPSAELQPGTAPHEKAETTHYSVVDKDGNAVSVTYTINGLFGANVIAPGTGFFLNDEMDDFTVKPGVANFFGLVQGAANAIKPGKRPLSSMAPTLVTKDGKVLLVLGSPGGSRIITIIVEAVMNIIDYGMEPQEAVDAPRLHHQWLPDQIFYESFGLSPDTIKLLEAMGHKLTEQTPWGAAELVEIGSVAAAARQAPSSGNDAALSGKVLGGFLYGANDNRRPAGAAVGY